MCHFAGEKMGTDYLPGAFVVNSEREIKYRQRRVLPETSLEVYQTCRNYMVKDSNHSICFVLVQGLGIIVKSPAHYREFARVHQILQVVNRK